MIDIYTSKNTLLGGIERGGYLSLYTEMRTQRKHFWYRIGIGLLLLLILILLLRFAWTVNYRLTTTRERVMGTIGRTIVGIIVLAIIVWIIMLILNRVGSKNFKL